MEETQSCKFDREKEAARKRALGELGELVALKVLVDKGFDKIRNLNDEVSNAPFADIYCEKGGKRYVVSVKARNKFQKNGEENNFYNLGDGAYDKAKAVAEKYGAEPYWMAVQFDLQEYSIWFGSLQSLNGANAIPISKCESDEIGEVFEKNKRHNFDFDFFKNK